MLSKIKKLEAVSRKLEPTDTNRSQWNKAVQEYADDFLDNFNQHTTFVNAIKLRLKAFDIIAWGIAPSICVGFLSACRAETSLLLLFVSGLQPEYFDSF